MSLKKFLTGIFILLIFILTIFLYRNFKYSYVPVGVVDLEKIIKRDSRYPLIVQLNIQKKEILKSLQDDINLLNISERDLLKTFLEDILCEEKEIYKRELLFKESIYRKKKLDFLEELEKDIKEKILTMEKEEDKKIAQQLQEFEKKQKIEFENFKKNVSEKYYLPKLNLILKLKTLNLTAEEKTELEKKLKTLEEEEIDRIKEEEKKLQEEKNLFVQEKMKEKEENLKNYQEFLKKDAEGKIKVFEKEREDELKKYLSSLKNILIEEIKKKKEIISYFKKLCYPSSPILKRIEVKKKEIKKLNREKEKILREILEDTKFIVEKITQQKNLDVVLTGYVVNINASDLTEEILKRKF